MTWDLGEAVEQIRSFNAQRGWGSFHNPKNLTMALAGEVGELAAELQWLDQDQAERVMDCNPEAVENEIADIAIYLLTLVDRLDIDLPSAIQVKLDRNQARFPVEGAP